MGKYDQFLAGLPPPVNGGGKYSQFTADLPKPSPTLQEVIGPGNEANARNFMLASGDPRAMDAAMADPVVNAKYLPVVTGMAGALSPIPGGATMGTVGGRQISNEVLRLMGKSNEIPSTAQQLIEGAGAALGDIIPIPMIKKSIAGKAIGKAEETAKVVTNAADKYPTSGTVGEVLTTLERQIDAGTITDPTTAKTAYDVTDFIHKNPQIVGKSNAIKVQAYRVGMKAQGLLNSLVPGRGEAAAELAQSQTIPRAIGSVWNAIPPRGKRGLEAALGFEGTRRLVGKVFPQ